MDSAMRKERRWWLEPNPAFRVRQLEFEIVRHDHVSGEEVRRTQATKHSIKHMVGSQHFALHLFIDGDLGAQGVDNLPSRHRALFNVPGFVFFG